MTRTTKNNNQKSSQSMGSANLSAIGSTKLFGGKSSSSGFLGKSTKENTQPDQQNEIEEFKSRNYGPITYTRQNISGSGFEASYFPSSESLNVQLRAKLRFADSLVDNGGSISSPNNFMNKTSLITILNKHPNLATQILPYFQWQNDEKQIYKQRFMDNISSTVNLWQNTGMTMCVNKPGWEEVLASPSIDISLIEGEAATVTEKYGFLNLFKRTDEKSSDHLQIEIVKKISRSDATTVNNIINTFMMNTYGAGTADMQNNMPLANDARGFAHILAIHLIHREEMMKDLITLCL